MRLERETFGPVLRAARQRRGISLHQLAADTKVSVDLWRDLEDNDFSRWPERIYARTYVRDYASRVGFDPESIVNEFCRLFPERGDRRAEGLMRAHAAIVQHDLDWEDDARPAAAGRRERRATDRTPSAPARFLAKNGARILAIALDLVVPLVFVWPAMLLHAPFWTAYASSAAIYHASGVFVTGRTFGSIVAERSIRLFATLPVARRLTSARTETFASD